MNKSQEDDYQKSKLIPSKQRNIQERKLLTWIGIYDKSLLDIIQVLGTLAIPFVLFYFSARQTQTTINLSIDGQQQEIFSEYLNDLTLYVRKQEVNQNSIPAEENASSGSNPDTTVITAKTLNTLRQLDPIRKGLLLKFLYDVNLVSRCEYNLDQDKLESCSDKPPLSLQNVNLSELSFDGTSILTLPAIDLSGARLMEAKLPKIDLSYAILREAKLDGSDLTEAQMSNLDAQSSSFVESQLEKSIFNLSDLTSADFERAKLSEARFINAKLEKADFTGADLKNSNLCGSNLKDATFDSETIFEGALYSPETNLPFSVAEANSRGMEFKVTQEVCKEAWQERSIKLAKGLAPK